jgi:hypothetical protein
MNFLLLIVASMFVSPSLGVHYTQRESFDGKLSPAISRLKEQMKEKLTQLRFTTSNTTLAPTVLPGDGDDILADVGGFVRNLLHI